MALALDQFPSEEPRGVGELRHGIAALVSNVAFVEYEGVPEALYKAHAAYWGWMPNDDSPKSLCLQKYYFSEDHTFCLGPGLVEMQCEADARQMSDEERDSAIIAGEPITTSYRLNIKFVPLSELITATHSIKGEAIDSLNPASEAIVTLDDVPFTVSWTKVASRLRMHVTGSPEFSPEQTRKTIPGYWGLVRECSAHTVRYVPAK